MIDLQGLSGMYDDGHKFDYYEDDKDINDYLHASCIYDWLFWIRRNYMKVKTKKDLFM